MERLVIDDQIKKEITKKYNIKTANVAINKGNAEEMLISLIDFAKQNTYEEYCLREATIRGFRSRGRENVPESEIRGIMARVTPDAAANIIGNYKKIAAKEGVLISERDYRIFSLVDDNEKVDFAKAKQENDYFAELYHAKIEAIEEVAAEKKKNVPECLSNMSPINRKVNKIVSISDANEQEMSFGDKLRNAHEKFWDYYEEHETPISLSFATGFVAGACKFLMHINQKAELAPALLETAAAFAIISAGAYTIYNVMYNFDEIKSFFKDKKTLDEAKDLELIDLLANWGKASKKFNDYKDQIEERTRKEGMNGLR